MRAAENLIQLDAEQWNALRGSVCGARVRFRLARARSLGTTEKHRLRVCVRLSTATSDFGGGPKGLSRFKLCVFFASVNICRRPRDRDREERQL